MAFGGCGETSSLSAQELSGVSRTRQRCVYWCALQCWALALAASWPAPGAGASSSQQQQGHLVCLQNSNPMDTSLRDSSSFTGKADPPLPTKFSLFPSITGVTSAARALVQAFSPTHQPSRACSATRAPGYRGS